MADKTPFDPVPFIAAELALPARGVAAVVELLAGGATVPFIARYRKEVTGGLDEVQIRAIEERRAYVLELEERRSAIVEEITKQGKLTDELRARIAKCTTKAELEDLYLPYKPKRRTRATIAREKGLAPLAERILEQPDIADPRAEAAAFVKDGANKDEAVPDVDAALAGARDIVAEACAEHAEVRALVRETFAKDGTLRTEVAADKKNERTKFEDYYDHSEPVANIPSHRFLAIRRGEKEGILRAGIEVDAERVLPRVEAIMKVKNASPFAGELRAACGDAFKRLLAPSVENDVRVDLKMRADREAVEVFADNLKNLLLAAPLGGKPVIGIDPGLRTGCKVAAVDATGKFLENITVYPSQGAGQEARARLELGAFFKKYEPSAVAVGNGTAGRETEAFVREVLAALEMESVICVAVSEAGASVYSASDVAREELPDLDLTVRGAISIARRLQDPLAELVKCDPKAIGVGQYQHDVHQPLLARKLGEVVESCVNAVGVELNTASAPLLAYVAGIGPTLAKKIVSEREQNGPFDGRDAVKRVSGLGPRAFEQCAGFLRVRGGKHPLDASAVHPERYSLVEKIATDMGLSMSDLVGNPDAADRIEVKRYLADGVGEPTLRDIQSELKKPGRDPRAQFEPPKFRDDVRTMNDLQPGMVLEGVVTNVTAFGAFVDVGVHQDGLVHVSQLSDRFVKDPREVVKVGDKLKVRVVEVDLVRGRIALTAKSGEAPKSGAHGKPAAPGGGGPRGGAPQKGAPQGGRPPSLGAGAKFGNNPFEKLLKR